RRYFFNPAVQLRITVSGAPPRSRLYTASSRRNAPSHRSLAAPASIQRQTIVTAPSSEFSLIEDPHLLDFSHSEVVPKQLPPGRQAPANTGQTGLPTRSRVINLLELSLTADASRAPWGEHSGFCSGILGSQGGPCDPTSKNDRSEEHTSELQSLTN